LAWDAFDLACFPYRWHFHPEYELTLITAGHGRRFVGDSIEPFDAGDFVLLGPHLPHTWHSQAARGQRSRAVVIRFAADFLGDAFFERPELSLIRSLLGRSARGIVFAASSSRRIGPLLEATCHAPPFEQLLGLLRILQGLAVHGRGRPLSSLTYDAATRSRDAKRIDRACRYFLQHLDRPLSLAEVASVADLSPAGFSRFFRRMTGRTFVGWGHEVRIGHACRMLVHTDRSVLDIAIASGFANLSNFNRVFRRLRSRTPREFRRQHHLAGGFRTS
ncbi:MAG: helix-turn-helix domain-containing protein, partial [Planctomycetia bacterium]